MILKFTILFGIFHHVYVFHCCRYRTLSRKEEKKHKCSIHISVQYVVGTNVNCSADPCSDGNTMTFDTMIGRTPNCPNTTDECDANISNGWYKLSVPMYNSCPGIGKCGTTFPVWLNGTDPSTTEGVVQRHACLHGPSGCCHKTYKIQIKNCTSFMAYCLPHLDSCPERYCFGITGECELEKTTTVTTTTSRKKHHWRPHHLAYHKELLFISVMTGVIIIFLLCIGGYLYRRLKSKWKKSSTDTSHTGHFQNKYEQF